MMALTLSSSWGRKSSSQVMATVVLLLVYGILIIDMLILNQDKFLSLCDYYIWIKCITYYVLS